MTLVNTEMILRVTQLVKEAFPDCELRGLRLNDFEYLNRLSIDIELEMPGGPKSATAVER